VVKAVVHLPGDVLPRQDVRRISYMIQRRFGADHDLSFWAPADAAPEYEALLADMDLGPVQTQRENEAYRDAQVRVFVQNLAPVPARFWSDQRAYFCIGRIQRWEGKSPISLINPATYTPADHPHLETHIFNRLSGRKWGFVNFPYGCLYMDPELGEIHPLGYRITADLDALARRPDNHKVVCIYGGSAAFSCYCLDDEMFATQLERLLNERHPGLTFTVLNFGMHDNVVMQEMTTFSLFAPKLRPDFVISHSGHNDIWYGLQDDPYLLNHHQIIYQRHAEQWSKKLHDSDGAIPFMYSNRPDLLEFNLPPGILKAIMTRYRQFDTYVRAYGGRFVVGLQPVLPSKGGFGPIERAHLATFKRSPDEVANKFRRALVYTYQKLSEALAQADDLEVVDFHRILGEYGADRELLWDHVHNNPDGDRMVAERYADCLTAMLR